MPRLLDYLKARQSGEVVLWAESGPWTVEDIVSAAESILAEKPDFSGRVVALTERDPLSDLLRLIAFDGRYAELRLLPRDMDNPSLATDPETPEHPCAQEQAGVHESQWLLFSSGTTGQPKAIRHRSKDLAKSVRHRPASRWLLTYSAYRMAGVLVTLQAILGGGVLCVPRTYEFDDVVRIAVDSGVDAISATPAWWRRLIMSGEDDRLTLREITLGGEIADQAILDELARRFPDAQLRHIYASTELGAGFVVRDGRAGFPAEWLGSDLAGVSLEMVDGELFVGQQPISGEGIRWHATGDLIAVDSSEARCRFLGRKDGVINVGGHKVHPEKIEQVLLSAPGIEDCVVYGKRSPVLGEVIVAEVVSTVGRGDLSRYLEDHCRLHLDRRECPAVYRFVERLQMTSTGKRRRDRV
ncbi:MAG TPA: fatty acid--CoA ligase family protein [Pirellulaceae bacterium]|nr:fatty acid--CoA ligase family protein [Pirellulaceae bacterium]